MEGGKSAGWECPFPGLAQGLGLTPTQNDKEKKKDIIDLRRLGPRDKQVYSVWERGCPFLSPFCMETGVAKSFLWD